MDVGIGVAVGIPAGAAIFAALLKAWPSKNCAPAAGNGKNSAIRHLDCQQRDAIKDVYSHIDGVKKSVVSKEFCDLQHQHVHASLERIEGMLKDLSAR